MCIQNILFVVSARANDFELASAEIKHILIQCEMLNVKRIIFVINFMDRNYHHHHIRLALMQLEPIGLPGTCG